MHVGRFAIDGGEHIEIRKGQQANIHLLSDPLIG